MSAARNTIGRDPTGGIEIHRVDNRFVPIQVSELIRALCQDRPRFGPDACRLAGVAEAIREIIDQEAAAFEHALADAYAPFDPDRDTVPLDAATTGRGPEAFASLIDQLRYLLEKANFIELTDVQIDEAVRAANTYGFKVRINPERVDYIAVWVRGRGKQTIQRRTLRKPFRGQRLRVEVYRRLAVIVRLKDEPHVIVKLFKDIPQRDVEALLPHAEIEMNWFDRIMMIGSGAGAAGTTGMKVLGLITKVAALGKLAWVLLVGLITVVVRTALGYRRARQNRDSQRTRHLYFQNLSNNAGAIRRLVGMIAEEETKEAILAYAFCRTTLEPIHDEVAFRTRIETFLRTRVNVLVDFDVPDALETITRLNLWINQSRFEVCDPDQAVQRLHQHWIAHRSQHYHAECIAARHAAASTGTAAAG